MTDGTRAFIGQLPVTEEWAQWHQGERWSFDFAVTLDHLSGLGIDGLNDYLDEVTGIVLTDIHYRPIEVLEDASILLRATGVIELY